MTRVLYVEDNDAFRDSAESYARALGYEVITAANGKEALEKLIAEQENGRAIELVVTDINMPIMDGLKLTEKLRQVGYAGPIAFVTGVSPNRLSDFAKEHNVFHVSLSLRKCLDAYEKMQAGEQR